MERPNAIEWQANATSRDDNKPKLIEGGQFIMFRGQKCRVSKATPEQTAILRKMKRDAEARQHKARAELKSIQSRSWRKPSKFVVNENARRRLQLEAAAL